MKRKISVLLVVDKPNWAFHMIAQFIQKHFAEQFDIYLDFLVFHREYSWNLGYLPYRLRDFCKDFYTKLRWRRVKWSDRYDIVFFMGADMDVRDSLPCRGKVVLKGIYTATFPPFYLLPGDEKITPLMFREKYLANADIVVCGECTTARLYRDLFPDISIFSANGWFPEWFCRKIPKAKNLSDNFIVGWCGDPHKPFKGFHDFVLPAVEAAGKKRLGIKLKTRFSGSFKTLPRFYDDVDVLLIASDADAGPSCFGEAACCDVPSISTHVGWPGIAVKDGENGFLVPRQIDAMVQKLVYLYDNRNLLYTMSNRVHADVDQLLGTEYQIKQWHQIFDAAVKLLKEK